MTVTDSTSLSDSKTFKVTVSDPAVVATGGFMVTGSEGSSTGSQTVATFTDPGGAEALADYSADIAWGDSSSSAGTITGPVGGVFTVSGSHTYADNGPYTITVTIHHESAPDATALSAADIANVAPTIAISGASNVDEGSPYSLTLGAVTDPGTDTVTAYIVHWGDGFSDTYGTNGVKMHTYADGPNVYAITVDLTDEDGTFLDRANALSVTVDNVAPTISGLSNSSPGCGGALEGVDAVKVSLASLTDPALLNDTYTATVDWGDGNTDTGVSLSLGANADFDSHVYANGGFYTVTVTAFDEDGGISNVLTTNVVVAGASVQSGVLTIIGTNAADVVTVNATDNLQGGFDYYVHASFLGVNPKIFSGAGVTKIYADLCDGDDLMAIAGNITTNSEIHGGNGNDHIIGGAGKDIIFGEAGNDMLEGGGNADFLIGGAGMDRSIGGTGNDILMGGDLSSATCNTSYSNLLAVLCAWATLHSADSDLSANGDADNDILDDAVDSYTGASGVDWFIIGSGDKVTDFSLKAGELLTTGV